MKTILEFLYKNHIKNVEKTYTLYEYDNDNKEVFVKFNTLDDFDKLTVNFKSHILYNSIRNEVKEVINNTTENISIFLRPIRSLHADCDTVCYIDSDIKYFKCLNKKISINDFTVEYWEKNNWRIKY